METQFEKVIQEVKASNKAFPNEAYNKYKLQFLNALRKYGEIVLPSFQDDNMQLWNIGDTEGNQDIIINEDIYYQPTEEQSVLRVQREDVNDEISTYKTKQELLDEDIPEEIITAIQEDPLFGEDIRDE